MRKLLFFISMVLGVESDAQQDWMYSMQTLNLYDGNAAAAGMYDRAAVNLRTRNQWVGIEGAPNTQLLSFHAPIKDKPLAFGLRIMHEGIGILDRSMGVVHLAYKLKLGAGELSFALGGGIAIDLMDLEALNALDDETILTSNVQQSTILTEGAALYRTKCFFLGVEGRHLLRNQVEWMELTTDGRATEVLAMAGATLGVRENWSLRPLVALRFSTTGQVLPEAQLGAWFKKTFWMGAGYRLESSAYAFAEYRIKRKYRIGYSFGMATQAWSVGQASTHEIMLGILFGKPTTNLSSLRLFQ
ncbi:MAG: type IX secretion system PorP/SprF family membrane protein [Flavobacteriales bacterium]|jgi:type IX secretion system PorP/SprF family membrane protein